MFTICWHYPQIHRSIQFYTVAIQLPKITGLTNVYILQSVSILCNLWAGYFTLLFRIIHGWITLVYNNRKSCDVISSKPEDNHLTGYLFTTAICRGVIPLCSAWRRFCFACTSQCECACSEVNCTWFSTCLRWRTYPMHFRQTKLESSLEALLSLMTPPSSSSSETFNIVACVVLPLNLSSNKEFSWLLFLPLALFLLFLAGLPVLCRPQHNAILYNFPAKG